MTVSERVYRTLLIAYPADHRHTYGEPMVQMFRDRMRRDGGGHRTFLLWSDVGFDLLSSAFKERLEAIMALRNWAGRWWETTVVLLAVNSVVFGFLFVNSGHPGWGVASGFVPGILLFAALGLRSRQRAVATVLIVLGSVAAATAWWAIYTIVLTLVIIVGGISSGRIGPRPSESDLAVV